MSNTIPNRQVICQVLLEHAKEDKTITVLCSDSRGSASLAPFAKEFPQQFVEMGIAEQSLVSTAAGMARCGLRPFAASPASFLSTRSMEQVKVDVAYSHTNVKLIGISGGISYGALGMTHHSAQDIAALASIPGLRVYLPSDRFLTKALMKVLVQDNDPAYIRVGRNAVDRVSPPGWWICTASSPWIGRRWKRPPGRPTPLSPWRNTACTAAWAAWSARWWGSPTR